MARPIDQKEYLKRYLSADTDDSSKKKRRKKVKTSVKVTRTFNIVDDDVDLRSLVPAVEKEIDLHNPLMVDETPLVADVIDERPKEEILLEQYRKSKKWKMVDKEEPEGGAPPRRHGNGPSPATVVRGGRWARRHDSSDSDGAPRHGASPDSPSLGWLPGGASDSDPTPPRRRRPDTSPMMSSSRGRGDDGSRGRHDSSDSDLSPDRSSARPKEALRRRNHGGRPELAGPTETSPGCYSPPPRKSQRHDSSSESDMSPPRRTRNRRGSGASPQRPDSDASPPRRRQARGHHDSDSGPESDLSPPRRRANTKEGDRKPPSRRAAKANSDSDLSPPRKGGARSKKDNTRAPRQDSDSDLSPPRRSKGRPRAAPQLDADSDSDLATRRLGKRLDSDDDLSPVRRSNQRGGASSEEAARSPRQRERGGTSGGKHRPGKTLSGTTAGLSDAKAMRRENAESRRRDDQMYSAMDDEVSGRNAKTVFRDKRSGQTRDLEVEKKQRQEEEAQKEKDNEQFVEWGKGVAQSTQRRAQAQEALQEVAKPLARYRDDKDLDEMLRQQEIEGDPMLQFLRAKRAKKEAAKGVKAKPKYKGRPPPPNRFNLMPGFRWDGVDRSNGFEKKLFIKQADRKATKEIAYKWSIEDM